MRGYQFSLRTMLAAVAAVGIGAGLWVAEPSWQVGLVETLVVAWIPASLIFLIGNSTGRAKALWIGMAAECLLTSSIYLVVFLSYAKTTQLSQGVMLHLPQRPVVAVRWIAECLAPFYRPLLIAWAFAPVVGLLCVLTHWLLIRPPQGPKD